jgi:hypothetical protein
VDKSYGIRVSFPKSWQTVPTSVAGVHSLIAQLERKKEGGIALVYAALIATAAARGQLLRYHFQAFEYLPGSSVQPDFALAFARISRAYTATDLAATSNRLHGSSLRRRERSSRGRDW